MIVHTAPAKAGKRVPIDYSFMEQVEPEQAVLVTHRDRSRYVSAANRYWLAFRSFTTVEGNVAIKRLA